MSFPTLPKSIAEIDVTRWQTFAPYFAELQQREITTETIMQWLQDWSQLTALLTEAGAMIYIEKALDTADTHKEQIFLDFLEQVVPPFKSADQALKERLLAAETAVDGIQDLDLVLRNLRNEADLFRAENIPLQTELDRLTNEYDKITGGMKVDWDGEEKNLSQLGAFSQDKDRAVRERAWQAANQLWLGKRDELNDLYGRMLPLRQQIAINAGLPDYRAYMFREMGRFDYSPADCFTFHQAIEAVVVPAAQRIYERKRQRLGLECLRPWDIDVDTSAAPALKPYQGEDALVQGSLNIFQQVDPVLGRHIATMAEEQLLDLDTRASKALGGFCSTLPLRKRPYIFMNGVGTHDDVQTMLHEAGHAFHVFETADLPYIWQAEPPMEFCEVASMSMELLTAPYLTNTYGGFYTPAESARAQIEHLESEILFLPYMAVVDAFQHWVYTHPEAAVDPAACDAEWDTLWSRFMSGVDWSGLEAARMSSWHRKLHIFQVPFYYIEYGMAEVGALQVWRNGLQDQAAAVANYRQALALGGTKTLPELFAAAGAEFRFDTPMLTDLVALIEARIRELEVVLEN
ncbi:MAG: M3 family oligoendopeptidase [Anaerolineales bacterium]|nr:M3 family oligoendopeptidase [Anaerolineales bacterium]